APSEDLDGRARADERRDEDLVAALAQEVAAVLHDEAARDGLEGESLRAQRHERDAGPSGAIAGREDELPRAIAQEVARLREGGLAHARVRVVRDDASLHVQHL